jgi:hypothetical protein
MHMKLVAMMMSVVDLDIGCSLVKSHNAVLVWVLSFITLLL